MTSKSPVARSPSAGRPPSRTTPPAKLRTQVYSLWSSAGFMLQKTPPVPPPPGYSPLPSAALKPPQPTKARTTIDPPRDRDPMLRQPLQQVDPNHSGVGATAGWAASKTELAAAVASVNQPQESGQTRRSEGTEVRIRPHDESSSVVQHERKKSRKDINATHGTSDGVHDERTRRSATSRLTPRLGNELQHWKELAAKTQSEVQSLEKTTAQLHLQLKLEKVEVARLQGLLNDWERWYDLNVAFHAAQASDSHYLEEKNAHLQRQLYKETRDRTRLEDAHEATQHKLNKVKEKLKATRSDAEQRLHDLTLKFNTAQADLEVAKLKIEKVSTEKAEVERSLAKEIAFRHELSKRIQCHDDGSSFD